jgi:hypothetical protein
MLVQRVGRSPADLPPTASSRQLAAGEPCAVAHRMCGAGGREAGRRPIARFTRRTSGGDGPARSAICTLIRCSRVPGAFRGTHPDYGLRVQVSSRLDPKPLALTRVQSWPLHRAGSASASPGQSSARDARNSRSAERIPPPRTSCERDISIGSTVHPRSGTRGVRPRRIRTSGSAAELPRVNTRALGQRAALFTGPALGPGICCAEHDATAGLHTTRSPPARRIKQC